MHSLVPNKSPFPVGKSAARMRRILGPQDGMGCNNIWLMNIVELSAFVYCNLTTWNIGYAANLNSELNHVASGNFKGRKRNASNIARVKMKTL